MNLFLFSFFQILAIFGQKIGLFDFAINETDCNHDICMSMIFHCENHLEEKSSTLYLDRSGPSLFTFDGFFDNYENDRVAVSIDENANSYFFTFWNPDLCSTSMFFVGLNNGTGIAHRIRNGTLDLKVDEVYPPSLENFESKAKRNSIAKVFFSLEDEFKVTVRMFYDDKFKDQFSSNAEDRLSSVMNHVQALYDLDSMVTKLHFEVLSIDHLAGITYNADYNSIQ